ncbi:hypothetical protein [Novosphingobium lindaniclasticum]
MRATPTKAEAAWLKRLQKVLDECPSERMAFYTTGDACITAYDSSRDREIDEAQTGNMEFCNAVEDCDAALVALRFPGNVASTCA